MEYKFKGREAEYYREWYAKAKQDPEWFKHKRETYRAYIQHKREKDPDWYERRKIAKRESYHRNKILKPKKPKQTKEERRRYLRKQYLKTKKTIIDAYGGKCECCGITKFAWLSIDHIDNCRPEGKKKHGLNLYLWLKRNSFPEGFRILCLNCNLSIGFYGYCPHKGIPDQTLSRVSKYLRKIKLQVVEAYGGKCSRCEEKYIEFLQIDHVNEDGKEHRANLKKIKFYTWLKQNNYPPEFQCLCANCNWEKHTTRKS